MQDNTTMFLSLSFILHSNNKHHHVRYSHSSSNNNSLSLLSLSILVKLVSSTSSLNILLSCSRQ